MPNCKSCSARLWWVRSASTGKMMPLDSKPDPRGNISVEDGQAHVLTGDVLNHYRDHRQPLYLNHFASCPNAARHRPG